MQIVAHATEALLDHWSRSREEASTLIAGTALARRSAHAVRFLCVPLGSLHIFGLVRRVSSLGVCAGLAISSEAALAAPIQSGDEVDTGDRHPGTFQEPRRFALDGWLGIGKRRDTAGSETILPLGLAFLYRPSWLTVGLASEFSRALFEDTKSSLAPWSERRSSLQSTCCSMRSPRLEPISTSRALGCRSLVSLTSSEGTRTRCYPTSASASRQR